MAKSQASALSPFVRSDVQGALLVKTLGRPDAEATFTELAELCETNLTTIFIPWCHN